MDEQTALMMRQYMISTLIARAPKDLGALSDDEITMAFWAAGGGLIPFDKWIGLISGTQVPQETAPTSGPDPTPEEIAEQNKRGMAAIESMAKFANKNGRGKQIVKIEKAPEVEAVAKDREYEPDEACVLPKRETVKA